METPSSYPEKDALRNMPLSEKMRLLDADAERILQQNAETEPEETGEPVERFIGLRTYFDGLRQQAVQRVMMRSTTGANPRDIETLALAEIGGEIGMTMCDAPFFGDKPKTVTDLANLYIEAEANSRKTDRLIDKLKDEIRDLKQELFLAKGNRK